MRVRPAKPEDQAAIESIISQHWKVNIDHSEEFSNPDAILLVAEDETNKIVGMALMWVTKWNKTGYLVEIAVDKEHMRRGYGSLLVEKLLGLSKERSLRAIIVETQLDRGEAIDFYLKKTFRMCGYNDRYYTNEPKSADQIAVFFSYDL